MYDITLIKPIILKESLDDMPQQQKATALKLLNTRKVLTINRHGIQILPRNDLPLQSGQLYCTGSEAVILYRQSLGLPGRAIKTIPVNEILHHTHCYIIAEDILFFLKTVSSRNKYLTRLQSINAPFLIQRNEYMKLQHDVERLQNNRFLDSPIRREVRYPDPDHPGRYRTENIPRASLCDIDFQLLRDPEDSGIAV